MTNDLEFGPLAALADLPGAALQLLLPVVAGAGLCLVITLGAMMGHPYSGLPRAERERVDPPPLGVPASGSWSGAEADVALGLLAVAEARAEIGKPYVWGAAGPESFDCSGLVQWAWARVGVRIPRFTVDQYNALQPVAIADLRPGDLVFLQYTYPADYRITHVGLFTERGTVIEAPEPGLAVREVPFGRYVARNFFGAARPRLPTAQT